LSKNISTLIADVYEYIQKHGVPDAPISVPAREEQATPSLRLSGMGPRCPCALWHSIHHPELAETLPPWATFKYAYGHIIEALAIQLAKAAGHIVEGEQDVLEVDGIKGHRDCVIDGCIVDVKSTTTLGFQKFKDGSIKENDPFGYLDQIDGYLVGSLQDPVVTVKDKGYLWAIDKQLGHMVLHQHEIRQPHIHRRIAEYKSIVGQSNPPSCTCGTQPDGKSGNIMLDTRASYSPFKWTCFPNLRCFLYSNGPRYLSRVERKPEVVEVNKDGKIIYS
jgi:hypothetical protein